MTVQTVNDSPTKHTKATKTHNAISDAELQDLYYKLVVHSACSPVVPRQLARKPGADLDFLHPPQDAVLDLGLNYNQLQSLLNDLAAIFVIEEPNDPAKFQIDPHTNATTKCDLHRWKDNVKTLWILPQTVRQVNLVKQLHKGWHYAVDRNHGSNFLKHAAALHQDATSAFEVKFISPSVSFFHDEQGDFITVYNHIGKEYFANTEAAIKEVKARGTKDANRHNLVVNYGYTGHGCPIRSKESLGLVMPNKMEGSATPFATEHHAQMTRLLDEVVLPAVESKLPCGVYNDPERNQYFACTLAGGTDQKCAFEASTLHLSEQSILPLSNASISLKSEIFAEESWAERTWAGLLSTKVLPSFRKIAMPDHLLDIHCDTNNDKTNPCYSYVFTAVEWAWDNCSLSILRCGRTGYGKQSCADFMDQVRLHGPIILKVADYYNSMPSSLKCIPDLPSPAEHPVQLSRPHLNKAGAYYAAFGMSIRRFLTTFASIQQPRRWAAAFHVILTKEGHRPLVWHQAMEHLIRHVHDFVPPGLTLSNVKAENVVWKFYLLLFDWDKTSKSNGICKTHRMQPFHNTQMSEQEFQRGIQTILTLSNELADLGNKLEDFNYLRNIYHRTVQLLCMTHNIESPTGKKFYTSYQVCGIPHVGHLSVHLVIGSAAIVGLFPVSFLSHAEVPVSTSFEKIYDGGIDVSSSTYANKSMYHHTQDLLRAIAFYINIMTAHAEELICQVKSINTSEPGKQQHAFADTLIPGIPFLVYNIVQCLLEAHTYNKKGAPDMLRPLTCLTVSQHGNRTAVMGPSFWLISWPDLKHNPSTKKIAADFCSMKHFYPTKSRRIYLDGSQEARKLPSPKKPRINYSSGSQPTVPLDHSRSLDPMVMAPQPGRLYLMEKVFNWVNVLTPLQILTTLNRRPCHAIDPIQTVLDHFLPGRGKRRSKLVFIKTTFIKNNVTFLHNRSTFGIPKEFPHPPVVPLCAQGYEAALVIQLSHCFQLFPAQIEAAMRFLHPVTKKKYHEQAGKLMRLSTLQPPAMLQKEVRLMAETFNVKLTAEQHARLKLHLHEVHLVPVRVFARQPETDKLRLWDPPSGQSRNKTKPNQQAAEQLQKHQQRVSRRRKEKAKRQKCKHEDPLPLTGLHISSPAPCSKPFQVCCTCSTPAACQTMSCLCYERGYNCVSCSCLGSNNGNSASKPRPKKKQTAQCRNAATALVDAGFCSNSLHGQLAINNPITYYCVAIRLDSDSGSRTCAYHADPNFPLFRDDGSSFVHLKTNRRHFTTCNDAKIYVSLQYIFDHRDRFCHDSRISDLWSLPDDLYQEKDAKMKQITNLQMGSKKMATVKRKSLHLPILSSRLSTSKRKTPSSKSLEYEQGAVIAYWRTFRIRHLGGTCKSSLSSSPNFIAVHFKQGGVAHYLLDSSKYKRISEYHLSRPFPIIPMRVEQQPRPMSDDAVPDNLGNLQHRPFVAIKSHRMINRVIHMMVQPLNTTMTVPIQLNLMRCHAPAECYDYAKEHNILDLPGFRSLKTVRSKLEGDNLDVQARRKSKAMLDKKEAQLELTFQLRANDSSAFPPHPSQFQGTADVVCTEVTEIGISIKGEDLTWADIGAPSCSRCRWRSGCDRCFQKAIGADL